jgi:hypothetical protein
MPKKSNFPADYTIIVFNIPPALACYLTDGLSTRNSAFSRLFVVAQYLPSNLMPNKLCGLLTRKFRKIQGAWKKWGKTISCESD